MRNCPAIIFVAGIGGVEYANFAVFDETATAVATVFVVNVTGPKRQFRHRVVDEVFRCSVHPRFIFVPVLIDRRGVPLTENVIGAVLVCNYGVMYIRILCIETELAPATRRLILVVVFLCVSSQC